MNEKLKEQTQAVEGQIERLQEGFKEEKAKDRKFIRYLEGKWESLEVNSDVKWMRQEKR